jgi:hypothetical protein
MQRMTTGRTNERNGKGILEKGGKEIKVHKENRKGREGQG